MAEMPEEIEVIGFSEDSNVSALTESIRNLPFLKGLIITSPRGSQIQWSSNDVLAFFEAVGSLEQLRKVQFQYLGGGDFTNTFPIHLLTAILSQPSCHLHSITLTLMGPISGTPDDMREFAEALRTQRVWLEEFRMNRCYFCHELLTSSSVGVDPVIAVLSTNMPALNHVAIKSANRGHLGHVSPESLAKLLAPSSALSFSLNCLQLDNMILDDTHISAISRSLQTNTALKELYLNVSGEDNLGNELAHVLQTNKGLDKLELRISKQRDNDKFLNSLALALSRNSPLRHFLVHGSGVPVSEAVEQAFCDVLESNVRLESLVLPVAGVWRPRMELLLRLNGQGCRGRVLPNTDSLSRLQWCEVVSGCCLPSQDFDALFYYIRIYPSVVRFLEH